MIAAHRNLIPDSDVKKRTFGGQAYNKNINTFNGTDPLFRLTRDSNGRFKDEDLAKLIQNAIESPAGAFGARGTPESLRIIEILGIEQSRSWGTCSVRFRSFRCHNH